MARPLIWALGILASVSFAATGGTQRIMSALGTSPRAVQPPQAAVAVRSGEPRVLTLQADLRGHYTAHATINGAVIRTLVDTGASYVALTAEDASKIGLRKLAVVRPVTVSTANGVVQAQLVRLDQVDVGGLVVRGVDAVLMPRGALGVSLLGMSYLRGLSGFEISAGRLKMRG
jgi:aspartyl protease family protein